MAYISGTSRNETPDASNSINRKRAYSPISEPHTIDRSTWLQTTDPRTSIHWTPKVTTQLQRTPHVQDYSKGSPKATRKGGIRGPHHPYKPQTFDNAITNATHTRHARTKRAPKIK